VINCFLNLPENALDAFSGRTQSKVIFITRSGKSHDLIIDRIAVVPAQIALF
jgi:nitrogen-specific signal transduction histidine kinase